MEAYPLAKDWSSDHVCDPSSRAIEDNIKTLFSKAGQLDHTVFMADDQLVTIPLQEASLENIHTAGMVGFLASSSVAKHGSKGLSAGLASSVELTTGAVSEIPMADWSTLLHTPQVFTPWSATSFQTLHRSKTRCYRQELLR